MLVLYCLCLVMLALHLCNGTLPIAWNVHNSHFSRVCLLGFKGITLFIHMEIKSCRPENNICLVGGLQEHCEQTYVDSCKNRGLSHPLWSLAGTKKFATASHMPSPFSIKEAWILTPIRWFFGTLVLHLLSLLISRIKLLSLAPTLHLLVYWSVLWWPVQAWTR